MVEHRIQLNEGVSRMRTWLFDHALPVWSEFGIDRVNGGFFERLSHTAEGQLESKRARVQPRQIYCFVEAGRLGWNNWNEIVNAGMEFFLSKYITENGTSVGSVTPQGEIQDSRFDLYNQAFAIFAYGHVADTTPNLRNRMIEKATLLLDHLKDQYAHPEIGFEEGNPRELPNRSNPHMHLFEASLVWESITGHKSWSDLADEIATLCLQRFIDQNTGALHEYFDGDWIPVKSELGSSHEPGHHFEWAWLLLQWGQSRKDSDALIKARKLYEIGIRHGIDFQRNVVVLGLNEDLTVSAPTARLWSQTEWIKAAIMMARIAESRKEREFHERQIGVGISTLSRFLDVRTKGLWKDKLDSKNIFVVEPVPASSFYHIICALSELFEYEKIMLAR